MTLWFGIEDENSELWGEEFFVEAKTTKEAEKIAKMNFPNVTLVCYGRVSDYYAEMMGLDTY